MRISPAGRRAFRQLSVVILTCGLGSSLFSEVPLQPGPLRPVILSEGWPIQDLVLNNLGTVALAGGGSLFRADGLAIVIPGKAFKFASAGDRVPGTERNVFYGFLGGSQAFMSLNERDEVAFVGLSVPCDSFMRLSDCLASPTRVQSGVFLYSRGALKKIALTGEEAPDPNGHLFFTFGALTINNRGTIVFVASTSYPPLFRGTAGLFLYSDGRIQRIALHGAPLGSYELLSFNDAGDVVFQDSIPVARQTILRFSAGKLTRLVGEGDTAPEGVNFLNIRGLASNRRGDVLFLGEFNTLDRGQVRALYVLRSADRIRKVVAVGDPTAIGGRFGYALYGSLDNSGNVLFFGEIQGGSTPAALFLFSGGQIRKIVATGEPVPGSPAARFDLFNRNRPERLIRFSTNTAGVVAFASDTTAGQGIFLFADGTISKVALLGEPAPQSAGESFVEDSFRLFSLNEFGEVAFAAQLCCGPFHAGLYLAGPLPAAVANGGFEQAAPSGFPADWETIWSNSGKGEALQANSRGTDSFEGNSTLRLHVFQEGGSVFILSGAVPVFAGAVYSIQSRLRYALGTSSDGVFFSVVQYDASDREIAIDETRGSQGESLWTWIPKRITIRTLPNAVSIRVRFGLTAASESFLDVDAVR